MNKLNEHLVKIKVFAFDVDGTLTDSIEQVITCFERTFKRANLTVPSVEAIKSTIGMSLNLGIQSLLPDPNDEELALKITELYRQIFIESKDIHTTKVFEHIDILLRELKNKGYKLAIASGKSRLGVDRVLNDVPYFKESFDYIYTGDVCQSKPNPQMLLNICQEAHIEPHELIGVGDAILDVKMCHNAKCSAIGVLTGVASRAELAKHNCDFILDKASDILNYI